MGDRIDFDGVSIGVGSTLFLTAARNLTVGDELVGGEFGKRVARETSATGVPYSAALLGTHGIQALLELIWEVVRAREFSERPSRFDSLFLWHDEAEARAWHYRQHVIHTSSQEVKVGLYEVEVRQVDRIWAANMNLISYLNDGETLETISERSRKYWSSMPQKGAPEIVLQGSVVIQRDLLERPATDVERIMNRELDQSIRNANFMEPASWTLKHLRRDTYELRGTATGATEMPLRMAGWVGLELEDRESPVMPIRGTSPVLAERGQPLLFPPGCDESTVFQIANPLSPGTPYRPVLICDRTAAHYWQLPQHWGGTLRGNWLRVSD